MTRRLVVALAVLAGALWAQPALAATITVNTTNPNTGLDGKCSLIEAIYNADHGTGEYPECTAGSAGADTIELASNATYTFTGALTKAGQVGVFLPVTQGPHDERSSLGRAGVEELAPGIQLGLQPVEGLFA